jgi:hypothetical protein
MNRIVVEKRVSDDGVLEFKLPMGMGEAGRDVRVTVEPISRKKEMTPDEWRAGILATAGGWQGDFERRAQGEFNGGSPFMAC